MDRERKQLFMSFPSVRQRILWDAYSEAECAALWAMLTADERAAVRCALPGVSFPQD